MVGFTDEAFGAKLLEAITAGLYDGNLNCLREYVQNSIDSKAKRIDVYFENKSTLVIKDNGEGMNREKLEKALQFGRSEKTEKDIGWRGIGIWSGVPTCRKIVIVTKRSKNPKLRIEINADQLREKYTQPILATKVLSEVTGNIEELELGADESIQDSHYTVIRLEEILPNQYAIFKGKDIMDYLSRNIPVPFNIEEFKLGNEISKRLLEKGIETRETVVFFEKKQIFRPPYADDLFFDYLIDNEFVIKGQTIAYGWFLSSKSNRALIPPNRGIYFKKKGMTIGEETLISKLSERTYNQWQYGEIHIINDSLRENAARNNFEANNDLLDPFYKQVGKFVRSFQLMNYYQSSNVASNKIEQLKKQADSEDPKKTQDKINRLKTRLERNRSFPAEPALNEMKKIIDKQSTRDKESLKKLEEQVEAKRKVQKFDPIKEKRDRFNEFIKTAHPSLKKHFEKTTQKGKMELNIDAMDPVKDILQQKTGLRLDTICKLSQKAYDWKAVEKGDNGPILKLSGEAYCDRNFGVMIHTLHDLFVNSAKHKKGEPTFAFFESMTEEERLHIIMDFNAAQDLVLRLIEKSTPNKKT